MLPWWPELPEAAALASGLSLLNVLPGCFVHCVCYPLQTQVPRRCRLRLPMPSLSSLANAHDCEIQ
jgi:hypothetical protein